MALTKVHNRMVEGAYFNVIDYGADATGNTDSTTEIQAAIDAAKAQGGGRVHFPAGKYLVSSTIDLTGSQSLIVSGDGQGDKRYDSGYDFGTAILTTGTHGFDLSNAGGGTDRTFQINIRDLNIQRLNNDNTGNGVHFPEDLTNFHGIIHIENVGIAEFENGIFARRAGWFFINQCSIQGNTNGADISGNIINVNNCKIIQNGQYSGSDQVNMNASFLATIPFGLRVSGNAINVSSTDVEDNGIGMIIDSGSPLAARTQCTVTGCYFESHTKQAMWVANSDVTMQSCYSNNNTYDKFYFYASNVQVFNCAKFDVINTNSSVELSQNGYRGVTETPAFSIGSNGISDYTAAPPIQVLARRGIPDDIYTSPINYFGYIRSWISEGGFSLTSATDTLNTNVDYNPLELNTRTLARTNTGGFGRSAITGSAVTTDDYFSVTIVGRISGTGFLTWKLFDTVNNTTFAAGTPNLDKDEDDIFTLQIWGSGLTGDNLQVLLYPGGEAQGSATQSMDVLAFATAITDARPIGKLPLGDAHIWVTTGAPSAGYHAQGETAYASSPTAGGNIGVVCVASGTPGTWKTFGAISA